LKLAYHTGERWWEVELHRLKGELLVRKAVEDIGRSPRRCEAETYFRRALDVARRQQAKSLELWAAMSLSRLWRQQGKREAARQLLTPLAGWFTEGVDTADQQEARGVL